MRPTLSYPYLTRYGRLEKRSADDGELIRLDVDSPIEIRDLEHREIFGRVVPYGERIMYRGKPESFARGALADIRADQVRLFDHHDRAVGKAIALEERDDGGYVTFRVSKTARGDELLELARDGVLSFSPGFIPGTQTRDGTHTRVKAMPEVSLVSMPAYSRAQVLAVREKEPTVPPETTTPEEETETRDEVMEALETRMEDLATSIDKLSAAVEAPAPGSRGIPSTLTPFNWFVAQTRAAFSGKHDLREKLEEDFADLQKRAAAGEIELHTRALDDVTGGATQAGDNTPADDLSGLVVEEFMADQLVNVLDTRRPIFANLGQIRMPRSGYATIPTVTQGTEVSARGAQKSEVPSQKMITTNADFKANWLAGGVDIALEVIRTAELSVLNLVWNDLLGQYARATERDATHGLIPFIEAGITGAVYSGTALATDTYANLIAAVLVGADTVEAATGSPAEDLFLTRAQYNALVGLINPIVLEARGDQGGSAINLQSSSFTLPATGIRAHKDISGTLTQAFLTNDEAFKVSDGGPERVEALNVALMGHDLGLLGRTMIVPRIPGGIYVFGTEPS